MKNIFTPKPNTKIRPRYIIVRHHNTATYSDKSLTALRPKYGMTFLTNIKLLTSITKFKGTLMQISKSTYMFVFT